MGEAARPGFSTLGDWVSGLGRGGAVPSALVGTLLVFHGASGRFGRVRSVAAVAMGALALLSAADAVASYRALATGAITSPALVPASLLVTATSLAIAVQIAFGGPPSPWSRRHAALSALTVAGVLAAIPLVRVLTFGPTRYARQADVGVVLGARVYDDGTPSLALSDRVDEGVRAYRAGLVSRLIMSGGVDPGSRISEAQVMRKRAIDAGVPPGAVQLDELGNSTGLTARNVAHLLRPGERVLLVTHYFHLPRAALLFRREGLRSFTLPARMTRRLMQEPWFVVREVPAYYVAWLTA